MPGKHKNPTISFRTSAWQRILIEERAALSGHTKNDFIARSCIYSNIVVVGNQENIERIITKIEEMQNAMKDIARRLESGNFSFSEEVLEEMKQDYLAFVITVVEILEGASYLFEKQKIESSIDWKKILEKQ